MYVKEFNFEELKIKVHRLKPSYRFVVEGRLEHLIHIQLLRHLVYLLSLSSLSSLSLSQI